MGFTDNCDVFVSLHEDGLNQILNHIRRQRPSLFNYATKAVADSIAEDMENHQGLLCKAIDAHELFYQPTSPFADQPLVTIEDALPIVGTDFKINFAAQVVDLQIDFQPADDFSLPPELESPLQAHRWAGKFTLCGGIGCPKQEDLSSLNSDSPRVVPAAELICFCVDAYAIGDMRFVSKGGEIFIEPFLDGLEILEIKPQELESNLECYLSLMLKLAILPELRVSLTDFAFNLTQEVPEVFPQPTNVVISPMPVSASVANNPAIEEDLLKVFIKVEVV